MPKSMMQVQLELEANMQGSGVLRFNRNNERKIESGVGSDTDWFRRLTREFVRPMADAIKVYSDYYDKRVGKPSACLSHLKCLSPESAAYISIKTLFDGMTNHKVTAQNIAYNIGRRIEDEVRFTRLDNAAPKYIDAIKDSLKRRANKSYKFEHDVLVHTEKELNLLAQFQTLFGGGKSKGEIQKLLNIDGDKYVLLIEKVEFVIDIDQWIAWSENDVAQLGAKMIDIFSNNMLLEGNPLICKEIEARGRGKKTAKIVPTDALEKWIEGYKGVIGSLSPAYEPCVVPPRDWVSPFNGGYHSKEVSRSLPIAKIRNKEHLRKLTRKQMPKVYQALNALQAVKWHVNTNVLATANEIRLRGLPIGMPQLEKYELPPCPVPSIYSELRGDELLEVLDDDQKEAFSIWKREVASVYSKENKRKSDVRGVLATIDQGLKLKDYENMHFVYVLDFRGRVNCKASLISPQGDDMQKSLIRFADSCPLGLNGAFWFKVQGANVWGWDKLHFTDRVANTETDEFKEMCLDIAADPITFTDWIKADKPWQFLSWCFEYAEFIEWCDEGNDEKDFLSKVTVAMDGSCSGIQHYSAMLRDEIGGKEVNLLPSDKPCDIYGAVSSIVLDWMESITSGYERDCPIYEKVISSLEKSMSKRLDESKARKLAPINLYKILEEWMRVGVNRSLTKKPVMTLPYGSSQLTCREAMDEYLTDMQDKADKKARALGKRAGSVHNFTSSNCDLPIDEAVSVASMMTWAAIGEVVVAARSCMKYIKSVCSSVSKHNKPLLWCTPTGFIVRQEVFEVKEGRRVKTQMLGTTVLNSIDRTDKIDVRKMSSSAAPNFVHSMDASHLTLAVCGFSDNGILSIAVIHDSFGTHAGKTEELRTILISTFVKMYKGNDVISDFKDYNEAILCCVIDVKLPPTGNLDLDDILESLFCFS